MPAPDPHTHTQPQPPNRAARRATRTGGASERRYPDPRRITVPAPRQWAMRRH